MPTDSELREQFEKSNKMRISVVEIGAVSTAEALHLQVDLPLGAFMVKVYNLERYAYTIIRKENQTPSGIANSLRELAETIDRIWATPLPER